MLGTTKKVGDVITIGNVVVKISHIGTGRVTLAITAPKEMKISHSRDELPPIRHRCKMQRDAERDARLAGYEGEPCPECKALMLVRSGSMYVCDNCGARNV